MTPAPTIVEQPKGKTWHSQSAEEVLAEFASTADGLSSQEAAQRLAINGPNELKEGKPISPLQIFFGQFKSLLIWILIAVGAIPVLILEMVKIVRHTRRQRKTEP
jgi:Ca2+-transporting ATPase